MMTPGEIKLMSLKAGMTLHIADAEGWSKTDSSRILANLAIKAGDELTRLGSAARRLIAYRDAAGPLNFQLEKADDFINELRAAIARAEGGE